MHQRCSRRQPLGHPYPSPKQAKKKKNKNNKKKKNTLAHTQKKVKKLNSKCSMTNILLTSIETVK